MKRLLGVLFVLLLWGEALATAQFAEVLFYKGEKMAMHSTPLESYFSADNPKERFFPRGAVSTACWRGYIGTWKIEEGSLYLVSLKEGSHDGEEIVLKRIFKGQEPPIKASWYSGTIRIPQGKMLRYIHMGFASQYEKDLIIEVKEGRVVKETVIDNTKGAQ